MSSSYPPPPPGDPQGGPGDQHGGYGAPQGSYGSSQGGYPAGYGGAEHGAGYPGGYGGPAPRNGFGLAALILGILALLACWIPYVGVVIGLVGLILGIVGRSRVRKGLANNGGIALAGIITSALGLLASLVVTILVTWVLSQSGTYAQCVQEAGNDRAAIDRCAQDFADDLTN